MESRLTIALVLIGGVIMGASWNRIKGFNKTLMASTAGAISKGYKYIPKKIGVPAVLKRKSIKANTN